jgi:hypothetical protein
MLLWLYPGLENVEIWLLYTSLFHVSENDAWGQTKETPGDATEDVDISSPMTINSQKSFDCTRTYRGYPVEVSNEMHVFDLNQYVTDSCQPM